MEQKIEYTEVQKVFIEWLKTKNYEPALWICPMEEGEFLFSRDSFDLVPDFKLDYPEYEDLDALDVVPEDGLWDCVSNWLSDTTSQQGEKRGKT
jgi:hypothetical protein